MNDKERSDVTTTDKTTSFDQSNHSVALLSEQIRLLYLQTSKALIASLLVSFACIIVFWNHLSQPMLIGWFVAIILLSCARFLLVAAYHRKNPSDTESIRWGHYFIVGLMMSAFLWSFAGGVFFLDDSLVHQIFLAYILGGMIAGGMATLSSYRGAFLLFALPVMTPYTYLVLSHSNNEQIAIGTTFLLFNFLIWTISRQLYQTIIDSFQLRFDNFDLINSLQEAQTIQNTINQELEAQITEKDSTQRALQTAKLELEQRIIERTAELALSNDRLYREKELFQVTLASIADAVITTDAMDKITYLNPIAEIYTGWSSIDVNGIPVQEVFQIKDLTTNTIIEKPLNIDSAANNPDKSKKNREYILTRRDKQEFIVDYSVAPIRNHQNQMMGSVLIFRDVTEQRKLTDKLTYQATHDSLTGLLNVTNNVKLTH